LPTGPSSEISSSTPAKSFRSEGLWQKRERLTAFEAWFPNKAQAAQARAISEPD